MGTSKWTAGARECSRGQKQAGWRVASPGHEETSDEGMTLLEL